MWSSQVFGFEVFYLFYHFFLYGFFGWIYESCLVSFQKHRWVNRGFLNGPVIPIYGAGATVIMMVLDPIKEHYAAVFFGGMIVASVLEFVTSWLMEKLFHAKWWDYSDWKFNLQGRICLGVSFFWGLLSVTMEAVLKPGMDRLIAEIPRTAGEYAGYVIFICFCADLTVTVISTVKLDKKLAELAHLRDELVSYVIGSRLYRENSRLLSNKKDEWIAEWKARTSGLRYTEIAAAFRTKLEELAAGREENSGFREIFEEAEERIRNFTATYQIKLEKATPVQKRLLRAFPNLKMTGREDALKDLKGKLPAGSEAFPEAETDGKNADGKNPDGQELPPDGKDEEKNERNG